MTAPNVIVIMVDQMKPNASALWGSRFNPTPGLARLAEEGAVYHRAYCPQPLCVPARIAFWTSLLPISSGCQTNQDRMPDHADHSFKSWQRAGFKTALIGKDHCFTGAAHKEVFDIRCEVSHYGFESGARTRGMDWWRSVNSVELGHGTRQEMDDLRKHLDGVVHLNGASYAVTDYPEVDYGTGLVTGQAERFIEQQGDTPFALWLSYPDPHTPYEAPRRHFDEIRDKVELWPWRPDEFDGAPERLRILHQMMDLSDAPKDELISLIACYHAMVNFIDEGVSRILDALERTGLRQNTIVVFCSDHGDFGGEHMMMAKGGAFWDCLTRIPLIVSWPQVTPERMDCHELVSAIDVVPTLLQLQGLNPLTGGDGQGLPGLSADAPRDAVFSSYGAGGPAFTLDDLSRQNDRRGRAAVAESLRQREWEGHRMMVRKDDWKYVHDPSGDSDELYEMSGDPDELYNLAGRAEYAECCNELRALLQDWNPAAFSLNSYNQKRILD